MDIYNDLHVSTASNALPVSSASITDQTSNAEKVETASVLASPVKVAESKVTEEASHSIEDLTSEEVKSRIDEVNQTLEKSGQGIAFKIDDATQQPVFQLVDRETNEVVRQVPSEDALKMMQGIQDYLESQASGSLLNTANSSTASQGAAGTIFNEFA